MDDAIARLMSLPHETAETALRTAHKILTSLADNPEDAKLR